MNKETALDIIAGNRDYGIANLYFDNLHDPHNCKVCDIGALIKELPMDKFNVCHEEIVGDEYNTRNMLNIDRLPKTSDILSKYYGLTIGELKKIQADNDRRNCSFTWSDEY